MVWLYQHRDKNVAFLILAFYFSNFANGTPCFWVLCNNNTWSEPKLKGANTCKYLLLPFFSNHFQRTVYAQTTKLSSECWFFISLTNKSCDMHVQTLLFYSFLFALFWQVFLKNNLKQKFSYSLFFQAEKKHCPISLFWCLFSY